ncbi:MAG: 4-(cytidine 5'-diphospho)-2-C-methyl-D-erythritol kinase [bacterium]
MEHIRYSYLAPAKVNFILKIGEKNPANNLHNIFSIIRRISIFDKVTFEINEDRNKLKNIPGEAVAIQLTKKELQEYTEILEKELSTDKNLIIKASNLFFNTINLKNKYINAIIEKNIPMQAGLGGGSSDAAGMLNILNKIYNNPLNYNELNNIAIKLGSDVSFYLKEKDSFVTGNGEIIKSISKRSLKKYYITVIVPKFGVSTKEAYDAFDDLVLTKKINYYNIFNLNFNYNFDKLNIKNENDFEKIDLKNCFNSSIDLKCENDFEYVMLNKYPVLKKIKNSMIKKNMKAELGMLSGSGSAMFGVFKSKKDALIYLDSIGRERFSSRIKFKFLGETNFKEKLNQLQN